MRARRHRRHVRGIHEIGARAGGPAAVRRHVHDDRHRRGQDRVDHLAGGGEQPTGRIDAHDKCLRTGSVGALQGLGQLLRADEADRPLDVEEQDRPLGRRLGRHPVASCPRDEAGAEERGRSTAPGAGRANRVRPRQGPSAAGVCVQGHSATISGRRPRVARAKPCPGGATQGGLGEAAVRRCIGPRWIGGLRQSALRSAAIPSTARTSRPAPKHSAASAMSRTTPVTK